MYICDSDLTNTKSSYLYISAYGQYKETLHLVQNLGNCLIKCYLWVCGVSDFQSNYDFFNVNSSLKT